MTQRVADPRSREEKLSDLRRQLASLPDRHRPVKTAEAPPEAPGIGPSAPPGGVGVLPVHPGIAHLLPGGGLQRGTVATVSGAAALEVSLVATMTAAGARVAVCGLPGFGALAAVEQGADLGRIAIVPGPLPDPVVVASILLDGADVVLCGLGGISVPPSRARAITARARSKGAVLLLKDGRWDGASLHLQARVRGYAGIGARSGRGRIRAVDVVFSARGRGCLGGARMYG
ncbi:hypothetical protein [Tsukamurella soli]|uniref:hypothetical protein n=1 Tax=Tsukamurella soli TaxID=644556 RepID=UPI00360DA776